MEALVYLIIETFIVGLIIVALHSVRKHYGIGLLFVFIGSIQFFQTILTGSVYNSYGGILPSPGSAVLYTSSLFVILLIFKTENAKKTRSIIFGLLFTNIVIALLSYISLEQILIDSHSNNIDYLKEIFNFDLNLFVVGTSLLFLDIIIMLYLFITIEKYWTKNYFVTFFVPVALVSIFDSLLFYSLNFYQEENFSQLLQGNIIGKVLVALFMATVIGIYLKLSFFEIKEKKTLAEVFTFLKVNAKH
jgi:hypothetical protein